MALQSVPTPNATATADHEILPAPGTVCRADGHPGSVLRPLHYPLTALCLTCGRPIRCERYFLADWYHINHD